MDKRLAPIKQVFLDMDGTIYHGSKLYPTTLPFLSFLKSRKIRYAFLSNNSSRNTQEYVAKMAKLGIETTPDEFYISTDYTIDRLKEIFSPGAKIFILGVKSIFPAFEEAGFEITDTNPDAVVIAFDTTLDYTKLCRAAYFIDHGIPAFATHPDRFCPTDEETFLVDCGAITAALETATGKKLTVFGKPDPGLLRSAAKRYGVGINEVLMAGDRLATDILVGINAGALTCRVNGPGADTTPFENVEADIVVNDLGELQKLWE